MRKSLALVALALTVGLAGVGFDAEAKRLGGAKSSGMQRQQTTAPPANNAQSGSPTQAAPAAGTAAAAAAPAAAAKRSWIGPIAGLAAGIGLMALASHFGFGEAMANMMMMALLAMVVLFAVGYFMRKRAAAQGGGMAAAGGMGGMQRQSSAQDVAYRQMEPTMSSPSSSQGGSLIGSRLIGGVGSDAAGTRVGNIPADFDKAAFERTAKDQFVALQAANDAKDLDRLRDYLSPEMFEGARADIAERGDAVQKTEVFGLNAQVIDVAEDAQQYIVSVKFVGSIREQHGADTEDLNEVWHLTKAKSGFGGWVIAGIQQG
jgi:predicted lipid-binding transport protein (Tim44 family)